MQSPEDPPRLLDETSDADADLRAALRGVRARVPSEEQLAALAARVALAPDPAAPNGDAGASSAGPLSVKGAALLAGGAAAVVGIVLFMLREPEALSSRASAPMASVTTSATAVLLDEGRAPAAERRQAASPASENPGEAPSPSLPQSPAPATLPLPTAASSRHTEDLSSPGHAPSVARSVEPHAMPRPGNPSAASGPRPTSQPSAPDITAPASEASLLAEARAALEADPARTLALTEVHRRTYPRGGFAQERELLAITALARLGRSGEAAARAARFRSSYPASPYLKRIDRLTEQ